MAAKTERNPTGSGFDPRWDRLVIDFMTDAGRPVGSTEIASSLGMHRSTVCDILNRIRARYVWSSGGPTGGRRKLWFLDSELETHRYLVLICGRNSGVVSESKVRAALKTSDVALSVTEIVRITKVPRTSVCGALDRLGAESRWASSGPHGGRRKLWNLPNVSLPLPEPKVLQLPGSLEEDDHSVDEPVSDTLVANEQGFGPGLDSDGNLWDDTDTTFLSRTRYDPPSLSIRLLEREQCALAALSRLPPERRTPEALMDIKIGLAKEERDVKLYES